MELRDSRLLVIGGAGFVGSHVVEQLLRKPVRSVVVLDNFVRGSRANLEQASRDGRLAVVEGSITDVALLERLMGEADQVVHLAALWLHECVHEPRSAVEVNVKGTYNVIEAAWKAGIKKIVYSSSASVYGNALAIPMTEDHPFNNRTMYGATKIAGEQFFRAFYEQHRLDYVGLRYMNIYGPRMDDRGAYVSVIVKFMNSLERGDRPTIVGDGSQAYDFIYVDDVARANVLALESDATDICLNVGTGVKTSINELVERLARVAGTNVEPEYLRDAPMFVKDRVGSIEQAEREIGFHWAVPLEEGLRRYVEWHRLHRQPIAVQAASQQ